MKVLFVRLPDEFHAQMVLLAKREQCSMQKLGVSAITSFLDMAEQHGRFNKCKLCGDTGWVPDNGYESWGFHPCECNPEGIEEDVFKNNQSEEQEESSDEENDS